jgi:hypothetical protein
VSDRKPIVAKRLRWLTLREAFEVVGQLTFGPAWDPTCIERPKDEQHIACKSNLIAAFQDESVEVHKRDDDHRTPLKTSEIAGEFFTVNLKTDRIYIDQAPGVDWECLTLERDLRRFLFKHDDEALRGPAKSNILKVHLEWLVNELKTNPKPKKKVEYQAGAKRVYGIGGWQFQKNWKDATRLANKPELRRPGRKRTDSLP